MKWHVSEIIDKQYSSYSISDLINHGETVITKSASLDRVASSQMASSQDSGNWQLGSSFTIKNLLNLPEDESTSIGRDNQAKAPRVSAPLANRPRATSPDNFGHYIPRGQYSRVLFTKRCVPSNFVKDGFTKQEPFSGGNSPYGILGLRHPMHKTKERPLFSSHQVQTMEKEFDSRKYLTEGRRAELAVELKLTETQVKTWFQNRRTKWRKELRNENPPREVPDGRMRHSVQFARHFAVGYPTN